MGDNLMSDKRHEQLLKAAEETVGLMNIGVDPNAALAKVAADTGLNDHEVDVVAHAVNNSKQLAHLQNNKGGDREAEFPLIDPDSVRAYGDCQPMTNADQNTGNRYGSQETSGDNDEAKIDAPDAVETQDEMEKDAGDYRLRPAKVDHAAVLREGWGIETPYKLASNVDVNPFSHIDYHRIGAEEALLRYSRHTNDCMDTMAKVAESMRLMTAPKWADVEATATKLGASKPTLDLIYELGSLEKFGEARADLTVKTASQVKVSQNVMDLAELCVCADTLWKQAADTHAAYRILDEQRQAAYWNLMPKEAQQYANLSANLGELAEPIEKSHEEFGGMTPEVIQSAIGGGTPPAVTTPTSPSQSIRQEIKNTDARAQLEGLMQDDYIGGHGLPDVVEAYNQAMSVNPNFGRAELISYIRHHLASQGGVPLDLQIRARGKNKPGEE